MGNGFARGIAALGIGVGGFVRGMREGEEMKARRDDRQREDSWRADRDALTKRLQADLHEADAPDQPPTPDAFAAPAPAPAPAPAAAALRPPAEIARYGINPDAPIAATPGAKEADVQAPPASVPGAPSAERPRAPKRNPLLVQAEFYQNLAQIDLRHGKIGADQYAALQDKAKQLRGEGVLDAYTHYTTTGDLVGAINLFDGLGSKRIDRVSVEARKVKDPLMGIEYDELRGKYQDGTPFEFNPTNIAYSLLTPLQRLELHERASERKARSDERQADRESREAIRAADRAAREKDYALRAGHLTLAQQEAAERKAEKADTKKARDDLDAAIKSGDPERIHKASAIAATRGVKVGAGAGATPKPDEFAVHSDIATGVTVSNKRDGSVRMFDSDGKLKAEIPAPGKAPAAPRTAPNDRAVAYLKANPAMRDAFDAKYGAGAAAKVLGK